ncbi:MAG: T9SS type A sorting domain-containing protein [Tannerellaceae bacterium]|jgi:hypothetical protein|nr:T9SS type A sorting domain-containing protein [Tannerellaceae bacterium]
MTNKLILTGIFLAMICGISPLTKAQSLSPTPGAVTPSLDPTLANAPMDYMGKVDFTSAYRFITSWVRQPAGAAPSPINPNIFRMYQFSVPLVADLDGDGNPELIGLGVRKDDNQNGLAGNYNGIQIYNGKTGVLIDTCIFPMEAGRNWDWGYWSSGNHGSPSPMAIVDSDRDGIRELIMGFPYAYGHPSYRNKLASFDLIPQKQNGITVGYRLKEKWCSSARYNHNDVYDRPIPTVVDLDGDGNPEILAYNKIYDAQTGYLLLELETMDNVGPTNIAYIGSDRQAMVNDQGIGFNYVYDMDGDGIYDVIAGGKIYRIQKNGGVFTYDLIHVRDARGNLVPDGRTGVADIDGDGKPDVVTVIGVNNDQLRIVVWDLGFVTVGPQVASVKADVTFNFRRDGGFGSNSYVYIGDIDGIVQTVNGVDYRLPEICVLALKYGYGLPQHPNVNGIPAANGGIPSNSRNSREGDLIGLTWDANPGIAADKRLKLSFVLEHNDRSHNTGFTMYDFDNDGMQEICYRDEQKLRIIKAGGHPYIPITATKINSPQTILFSEPVASYTGFEYPAIADIDNDGSAEMVVMGDEFIHETRGFIYALGNGHGDKFAAALPVWNQFMYDPFKIDPYTLQTPKGPAPNRLSANYKYTRIIRDMNGNIQKSIQDYNPFNGTLLQATKINGDSLMAHGTYEPLVFLPEVYIVDRTIDPMKAPKIVTVGLNHYIEMTVGNNRAAKVDVSSNMPIRYYSQNTVSKATMTELNLDQAYDVNNVRLGSNFTIPPGTEKTIRINIPSDQDIYIVRLGDNSYIDASGNINWKFGYNRSGEQYTGEFGNGTSGQSSRAFRDGNWNNQVARVAQLGTFPDFYTIQELDSVEMDILSNDILPDIPITIGTTPGQIWTEPPYLSNLVLADSNIIQYPKAGYLTFNYQKGGKNRIFYHHNDSGYLVNSIDTFIYRLTFRNPQGNWMKTEIDTVCIYVMHSKVSGFTVCANSASIIELEERPSGVIFEWYNEHLQYLGLGRSRSITTQQDSIYWLKPHAIQFPKAPFPLGKLKVSVVPLKSGSTSLMKWTGELSTNWRDPMNWVAVETDAQGRTYETHVDYSPAPCTNVIIPSRVNNFPELTRPVTCDSILMKDRAMLKNPHALQYKHASVEIKLKPSEQERFVMWSAPLAGMVSGDYHYRDKSNKPQWGDVFMNFFQKVPGASSVVPNRFTPTTDKVDYKLDLGVAFNLKVKATSMTKDSLLSFPRAERQYSVTTSTGTTVTNITRPNNHGKFITDGSTPSGNDNTFDLKVIDHPNSNMVQVVNPYMAYLDIRKFLVANSAVLHSGYYLWNGEVNSGFYAALLSNGYTGVQQHFSNFPSAPTPVELFIPPLQSFFVAKQRPSAQLASLKMSPNWTTTVAPVKGSYTLRSMQPVVKNVLNIELSQGEKKARAAIVHNPKASNFIDRDDMPAIDYSELPLTLYTFSSNHAPLIINVGSHLDIHSTAIGMRIKNAGETKLSFANLRGFGYDAILVDKLLNKEINLQQNPEYTFTVTKNGNDFIEINDRFVLKFKLGNLSSVEDIAPTASISVTGEHGHIDIRSGEGDLGNVQVYDALGKRVYNNASPGNSHLRIQVESRHIYIVRATVAGKILTEKVMVK